MTYQPKHYTGEDVKAASRAIARKNMPNASEKLIDHLTDLGEWDDAARWVLDAVAPAIAARAKVEALTALADEMQAEYDERTARVGSYGQIKIRGALLTAAGYARHAAKKAGQ